MRTFIIMVVLLLAGCGAAKDTQTDAEMSASPSTATPTASQAPAATRLTATPKSVTPTTLTREQAAARYLALAKPINAIFDEPKCKAAEEYMVEGGTWPPDGHSDYGVQRADQVLRGCHKRLVPLYQATIKAFQTTAWPVDSRADVTAMILQDQAFLYCLTKTTKATSSSAMYRAIECFPEDDGSADRVRARFGLPGRTKG